MGDFFLTYDETGRTYFRRLIYANVLLYIVFAFIFAIYMVDITILILAAVSVASTSFAYALYFISKNPPIEPEEEYSESYDLRTSKEDFEEIE